MSQREENQNWAVIERDGCLAEPRPAVSGPMHRPIIKIFTVYESESNRDRAQLMREHLARRLGQSFIFSVSWRSLESLEEPEMRKSAARSVAEADIICFSLLSAGELPQIVTKWMEKVIFKRKTRKLCLLALLETGGVIVPRPSGAEIYLSHLSRAASVDCLCYSDSMPVARSIRNNKWETQPGKKNRPAKRAPLGDAQNDQEFPANRLSSSSRPRLARPSWRGNLQP